MPRRVLVVKFRKENPLDNCKNILFQHKRGASYSQQREYFLSCHLSSTDPYLNKYFNLFVLLTLTNAPEFVILANQKLHTKLENANEGFQT